MNPNNDTNTDQTSGESGELLQTRIAEAVHRKWKERMEAATDLHRQQIENYYLCLAETLRKWGTRKLLRKLAEQRMISLNIEIVKQASEQSRACVTIGSLPAKLIVICEADQDESENSKDDKKKSRQSKLNLANLAIDHIHKLYRGGDFAPELEPMICAYQKRRNLPKEKLFNYLLNRFPRVIKLGRVGPRPVIEYRVRVGMLDGTRFTASSNQFGDDENASAKRHPLLACFRSIVQQIVDQYGANGDNQHRLSPIDSFDKIAAIVVTDQQAPEMDARVLCMASGNSLVIDQQSVADSQGLAVLVSHAECIAQRAFKCLLYDQLLNAIACSSSNSSNQNSSSSCILERCPPPEQGFRLKSNLKLHLYLSGLPSGTVEGKYDDTLRYIALARREDDSNEEFEQTVSLKDHWSRSANQFLSPVDKMTSWNVVGIQGTLLSAFLEPIHISSIIIDTPSFAENDANNLARALYGRFVQCEMSPQFEDKKLNKPQILSTIQSKLHAGGEKSDECVRANRKSNLVISHNWFEGCADDMVEWYFTETGRPAPASDFASSSSRLSKRNLLDRWRKTLRASGRLFRLQESDDDLDCEKLAALSYREVKTKLATLYAKYLFRFACDSNGYGWILPRKVKGQF